MFEKRYILYSHEERTTRIGKPRWVPGHGAKRGFKKIKCIIGRNGVTEDGCRSGRGRHRRRSRRNRICPGGGPGGSNGGPG